MPRKKKVRDINWLLNRYMHFYQEFGMNEENIRSYHEEWKERYNQSIEDFANHVFNILLQENASQSQEAKDFYKRNFDIYLQMGYFRRVIEGQNANEIQRQINHARIAIANESNLKMDAIVIPVNDCPFYSELIDKRYPIIEALNKDVVPYERCTRKQGCACTYGFEPLRNSEGSLIRKIKN